MSRLFWLSLVGVAALAACSREQQAPVAAASAPAAAASAQAPNAGKTVQVQQAGTYTYAEVQLPSGQRVWIAGTQIDIKPGDDLAWGPFAVMRNFEAKSLGRTFGEILFVTSWGRAGGGGGGPPRGAARWGVVPTPPHGSLPMPPAPGAADASGSGIVKSVANAGGYSYIEVDRDGRTLWVAAMETPLKPGDRIAWQGGSEMRNFNAKSLGRTFERVVFASGVSVER